MSPTERDDAVATAERTFSPIVELRQYTLHPGKRDALIELFDREFIESQEALEMSVIGQFRDVDDPDRFVWVRGFRDMAGRLEGLRDFYGGSVWQAHRAAANATMIDSDNVLLLRPAQPGSGFSLSVGARAPRGTIGEGPGLVIATIYSFDDPPNAEVIASLAGELEVSLLDAGARSLACFVSEAAANNFPALPVRENEHVLVWFAGFADATVGLRWTDDHATVEPPPSGAPRFTEPPQRLRLIPTARSRLTGI